MPTTMYGTYGDDELLGGGILIFIPGPPREPGGFVDDSDNFIFALTGNDRVWGLKGNDYMDGGRGSDLLLGGAGNDTVIGGAGEDEIAGGAGNNLLQGGADKDTFTFGKSYVLDPAVTNGGFDTLSLGNDSVNDVDVAGNYKGGFVVWDMTTTNLNLIFGGSEVDEAAELAGGGRADIVAYVNNQGDHVFLFNGFLL